MSEGRKRGKLSTEEEKFILAYKDKMPIDEIAKKLNRTTEPILRFITEKAGTTHSGMEEREVKEAELRKRLKARPYYSDLKAQFSEDELEMFSKSWLNFMLQFHEDVLWSEEIEIKRWITIDILIARGLKERFEHMKEIERLTKYIEAEYKRPAEDRDPNLAFYEGQLTFFKGAVSSFTNDQVKLESQIKDIKKDLKAARSDRIKLAEDGKVSFIGLIKLLDDMENKERIGNEAAILSIASDKAKNQYGDYHEYLDGKVARPFLTSEIVLEKEKDDGEQAKSKGVDNEEGEGRGASEE